MILTNTRMPREGQKERGDGVGRWGGGVYGNDAVLRMTKTGNSPGEDSEQGRLPSVFSQKLMCFGPSLTFRDGPHSVSGVCFSVNKPSFSLKKKMIKGAWGCPVDM